MNIFNIRFGFCFCSEVELILMHSTRYETDKRTALVQSTLRFYHSAAACHPTFIPQPGVVQSIQILVVFDLLRDTPQLHIVVETLTLLFGINAGVWG